MPIRPLLSVLLAAAPALAAPVLQTNTAGRLVGATGVDVLGTLYNVEFIDGTCDALFDGCVQSRFSFSTRDAAQAASRALLDQVFVDGPILSVDSRPSSIQGCENDTTCYALTPYERVETRSGEPSFYAVTAINSSSEPGDGAYLGVGAPAGYDSTNDRNYTWARWSLPVEPPLAVPEPSSLPLVLAALAGAAMWVPRRRARQPAGPAP